MPDADLRYGWINQVARLLAVALATLAIGLVGLGTAAILVALVRSPFDGLLAAIGGGMALLGLLQLLAALLLYGLVSVFLKMESHAFRVRGALMDLAGTAERQQELLTAVADSVHISDAAKTIAHREKERNALRDAIYEEINRRDWEAAYYLIDEMERRYGYRHEAARLRREVDISRDRTIEQTVEAALERIDHLFTAGQWDQARGESERLMRLFPTNERIQRLPEDLERHRQRHKRLLLNEWNEAVQRNEIDRSIEVLKRLDQYLAPSEAAALEESARGVFRAKLQNMGVQFSLAVTDKRWNEAVEIGEQIVREFPNSLMAKEVTSSMPVLRRRAGLSQPSPSSS
jgi:tetratricopeptide (TPR) repeat protein